MIKVNPYEIARLAANQKQSTTEFIESATEQNGTVLKRGEDNACQFLTAQGCGVHPERPLVCRLYPLGRDDSQAHGERFFRKDGVRESEGKYDQTIASDRSHLTVERYLQTQGAAEFIAAVDAYNRLTAKLVGFLASIEECGETESFQNSIPNLMDIDACLLEATGPNANEQAAEAKMQAHIAVITRWMDEAVTAH